MSEDEEELDADLRTSGTDARIPDETFPQAGMPMQCSPLVNGTNLNPIFPFHTIEEYKLARFLHHSKEPKHMIADYFKDGLAPLGIVSFKSGETLHKKLDEMVESPE